MHQIISYIKFLYKSTNQHGVHSPFVFDLVTECFYDKKAHPAYETIRQYRKKLLQNKNSIEVKDFGAGSRVFTSDHRKVSAIARNVGITPKRARLLNRLMRYLEVDKALELGTSLGISTAAMAAVTKAKITSIEGCPKTAEVALQQFREFGFRHVELKVGEFEVIIDELLKTTSRGLTTYDLVFIDGNHRKEATLNYFEKLLPIVNNESVLIFDDIHWSKEMEVAWEEIKLHPAVTVTIDTFSWGFVFFRREQAKEHFVIRV